MIKDFTKDMWKDFLYGKHKLRDELWQKDETKYPVGAAGVTNGIYFALAETMGTICGFIILFLIGWLVNFIFD